MRLRAAPIYKNRFYEFVGLVNLQKYTLQPDKNAMWQREMPRRDLNPIEVLLVQTRIFCRSESL